MNRDEMLALVDDVAAGVRVLRTRDGVAVTDDQIAERARNIAAALLGNYRIEPFTGVRYARPPVTEDDFSSEGRIR
jgi:hypothetical protein